MNQLYTDAASLLKKQVSTCEYTDESKTKFLVALGELCRTLEEVSGAADDVVSFYTSDEESESRDDMEEEEEEAEDYDSDGFDPKSQVAFY